MQSTRRTLPLLLLTAAVLTAVPATAQTLFTAQLSGRGAIPPNGSDAYGACTAALTGDDVLAVACEHGVDDPTSAVLEATTGSGPVSFSLAFDGAATSPLQGRFEIGEEVRTWLQAGFLHVQIGSAELPSGEIGGRLLPAQPLAHRRVAFPLRPGPSVPPAAGNIRGACSGEIEVEVEPFLPPSRATVHLRCAHDVGTPLSARLHRGARGEDGPLELDFGSPVSPFEGSVEINGSGAVSDLLDGEYYVEVTSNAFPDGHLRGQVNGCQDTAGTICLNQGRFAARIAWTTLDDAGDGRAVRETGDSGMFWFFRPDNLEMLIKVLDGCAVNGHYWVFFSATTDVGYQLRVTDSDRDVTRLYENRRGSAAQPRLDTTAFECE